MSKFIRWNEVVLLFIESLYMMCLWLLSITPSSGPTVIFLLQMMASGKRSAADRRDALANARHALVSTKKTSQPL